jgi:hypothetical protein
MADEKDAYKKAPSPSNPLSVPRAGGAWWESIKALWAAMLVLTVAFGFLVARTCYERPSVRPPIAHPTPTPTS